MKTLLVLMIALCLNALAWPQTPKAEASAKQEKKAFELQVSAPADLRALLEAHLDIQRYRALDDLSEKELDLLIEDAQTNALDLAATLGYFNPVIRIEKRRNDAGLRQVFVNAQPGLPAKVAKVRLQFKGPIALDPAAAAQRRLIQDSWGLPSGTRFTQEAWDAAKQNALKQLISQRYPNGKIEHSQADVDAAQGLVALDVTLASGDLYRWGRLEIQGLQRYDKQLATRLAQLPTGQPYNLDALIAAQRRLTDSAYFDNAYISLDTSSAPEAAIAVLKVQEAPLKHVKFGIGASTDSGIRLNAEHTHMLVPGLGWQANSKFAIDNASRSLGVALLSPPDADDWRISALAEAKSEKVGRFDLMSQRARGGLTKKTERFDRSYFLQYDRSDSVAIDAINPSSAQSVTANYGITMRNFDAMPLPNFGWGLGLELGAGTTLGADRFPFTRVHGRWQNIWTMASPSDTKATMAMASRLSVLATIGAVTAQSSARIPASQLFLAGGSTSVRGYALNSLGVTLSDGQISPGRYLATSSLEWQRPLMIDGQASDWETTVFLDTGAVANLPGELRFKSGVGAGVRWKTPIGPLQMDLAYGLAVHRLRLHLNLGFTF